LASRPEGLVDDGNFRFVEEPVPVAGDGQLLVRNLYLSIDPTQRGWMARDTYLPAVTIGDVMRSMTVGRVVASRVDGYAEGDVVSGMLGWQDYAVVDGGRGLTKLPPGVPIPLAMSVFGVTGLTAYFGLLEVGRPKAGETVVVSGAAGATGSVVGQIARIKGCRAVGIAGGPEKCRALVEQFGFDAAIDYKSEDVGKRLRELCPKGIDVFFDNVGGEILDDALANLAMRGRVVLCGAISQYSEKEQRGPKNYLALLVRRGRMEGFLIMDHLSRAMEAVAELAGWVAAGKIRSETDIVEGLENAPRALRRLFLGENRGKQLVKIAD
jgi:NADPH-dependent curcumin reductase CurA